ncbi:hypothetical protein [Candidatus Cyanaurora vandensis]|uniref:hypothetical protein n=1 Tax=Candidatus Cyanaurora vandensis TaxID=2714958 RepID=UPI00257CDFE1|nr:hypothetical protein [Candidatus Cyanaurora vandensis]
MLGRLKQCSYLFSLVFLVAVLTQGVRAAALTCTGLTGITSGQIVGDLIFVQETVTGQPHHVDFFVDGVFENEQEGKPYYLGGDDINGPFGYDTSALAYGTHRIEAKVYSSSSTVACTNTATFVTATATWSGLQDGQQVTGKIYVQAIPTVPVTKMVFAIDGATVWTEGTVPYFLGGDNNGTPFGYNTDTLSSGDHKLTVTGYPSAGGSTFSSTISFNTGSSTSDFSAALSPYARHETASSKSVETILNATTTPGLPLYAGFAEKRRAIVTMYRNVGIDISLPGSELRKIQPENWADITPQPLSGNYLQPYSIDAPFYHKIPANPRVELPRGYVNYVTLATEDGSNTQQGYTIGKGSDPFRKVKQVNNPVTTYTRRVAANAKSEIPVGGSDKHLSFIDSTDNTVVTCYHTRLNSNGVDFDCDWAGWSELGTLGDQGGGTNATDIPNLAMVLREGEATHPTRPIPHALSGPMGINWKAIVYPGLGMDGSIDNLNYGLVPYGGVIQLDPNLDLTQITVNGRPLTLPALRLLKAIQDYGYYVIDNRPDSVPTDGETGLGIWTTINASEFSPFGNAKNHGTGTSAGVLSVQDELKSVLNSNKLFVVPPLVKR